MIQKQLEKIQDWLEQHAPKIVNQSLNSAANTLEISQFEHIISKPLPDDFKQLYCWHNGMNDEENLGSLFYGMEFLSFNKIKDKRVDLADLVDELFVIEHADPQINKTNAHHPDWIIFAHDGGRTGLYLDLAPTSLGKVGQIIFVDHDYNVAILVANSIAELIQQFSEDLQQALYHLNEEALEDDNEFLETDASIDLVNWYSSQRWARPHFVTQ